MTRFSAHLRQQYIGLIALFFALTGGAYALQGKNTVDSGDIKPKNVKSSDLAPSSVDSSKVADDSLTGVDIDEGSLGRVPSAESAVTADSAQTANTATNAQTVGGQTAAQLDDGPLAFAKVKNSANAAVDTVDEANSQGITDANVAHPNTGNYCFDLPFTPHVAYVTPDFLTQKAPNLILPPATNVNCGGGTDMSVQIINSDGAVTLVNSGFTILIY